MRDPRPAPYFESWTELLASRRPLPWAHLVAELSELAVLLDEAHARGEVHGAFDPSAITSVGVEDRAGKPRVVGFGRSPRGIEPRYQAPELRDASPSGAADRYGLAVLAFEALTLWPVDSVTDARPSAIDPELEPFDPIFLRALSADPKARFPTAADFVQALGKVAGTKSMTPGWGVLRPVLAGLGVVVVFSAGLWFGRRSTPEKDFTVPLRSASRGPVSASREASLPPAPRPRSVVGIRPKAALAVESGGERPPLEPGLRPPPRPSPSSARPSPSAAGPGPSSARPISPRKARREASAPPTPPPNGRETPSALAGLAPSMAVLARTPNDLEAFRAAHAAFRGAARELPPPLRPEIEVRLRNLAFLADGPGLLQLYGEIRARQK